MEHLSVALRGSAREKEKLPAQLEKENEWIALDEYLVRTKTIRQHSHRLLFGLRRV